MQSCTINSYNVRPLQLPPIDATTNPAKGSNFEGTSNQNSSGSSFDFSSPKNAMFDFSGTGTAIKEMPANDTQSGISPEGEVNIEDMLKELMNMLMSLLKMILGGQQAGCGCSSSPISGGGGSNPGSGGVFHPGAAPSSMSQKGARQGEIIQSQKIPGLNVFTGPSNDTKAAQQLLSTIEKDYQKDPNYKAQVDDIIKRYGSANATVADTNGNKNGNPTGTVGWGTIGGNDMIIDETHVTNSDTIAHEFSHNDGFGHGAGLDNNVRGMLA